ncbi:MAG: GNAT family N-acetyltransferase [Bacteroidales bacterium]|jgi:RimJ/RimL family protein N-acetyltransferase|nr:GNAT family N-acetyltransferase [Bacteroidales bacterium]
MIGIIETNRLYLRQLTQKDLSNLSLVLSDKESMRFYPHAFTLEEVAGWIEKNIKRYENDGFGLWAVIRKEDNLFLGDCGITLQNIDGEILPEIGFHIIKSFCNKGYATEAAEACKEYAIRKLGFKAIYSYSELENKPSQRVASKIGMSKIKTYKSNGAGKVVYEYKIKAQSPVRHLTVRKIMAGRMQKKCADNME